MPLSLNSVKSLEAAIDPNNKLTFLLDWELTMKCNLDCSYCDNGLYGGHLNSQPHPALAECLNTIDFLFAYVDKHMSQRISALRHVVLNVYGGEALYHPQIVEILQAVQHKYQSYRNRWSLTVTSTTNAIVSDKQLRKILPLIDEFTVSYHSEASAKQKNQFKKNCLTIQSSGVRVKCVVLMHAKSELFEDSQNMIAWLEQNKIKYLPRQLDRPKERDDLNYQGTQIKWFDNLYQQRSKLDGDKSVVDQQWFEQTTVDMSQVGRACCGGRQLCADQSYGQRHFYVKNQFPNWYCSVDKFFLYVKQVTGEVFVNKDCKMNYQNQVGPIGYLSDTQSVLDQIGHTKTIQCRKSLCYCGLCAPKAQDFDTYKSIVKKYEISNTDLLQKSQWQSG